MAVHNIYCIDWNGRLIKIELNELQFELFDK